jgi:hypothetical protein
MERLGGKGLTAGLIAEDSFKQIGQPVSRQNHPPISNPARTNNVARRKHGSRYYHRAILIRTSGTPDKPAVAISNLWRNLEALFCPGFSFDSQQFWKLAFGEPGLLRNSVVAFWSLVRFALEVITPSQNLCRSIGCPASVIHIQISFPPLSWDAQQPQLSIDPDGLVEKNGRVPSGQVGDAPRRLVTMRGTVVFNVADAAAADADVPVDEPGPLWSRWGNMELKVGTSCPK